MASRSKRAAQRDRQRDEPTAAAAPDPAEESDDELEGAEPAADEMAAFAATPEALAALSPENDAGEARSMVIDFDAAEPAPAAARSPLMSSSALVSYLQELRVHPLLDREEEHTLAVKYAKTHDDAAARRLITANLRLVVKISQEYRRAHKNLLDLIQEGNIGLIQAVQKYDPYRGVKLSSYAAWWIRAYILKFILANWRIVKIGTTQAQRKLFFNLRKEREKLEKSGLEVEARHLAAALDVTEQDVVEMERRLGSSEMSLDSPVRGDEGAERSQGDFVPAAAAVQPDVQAEVGEFQELLRQKLSLFSERLRDRELDIFRERLLSDAPATLQEIGEKYGVSRERARQIEERLKKKLRNFLQAELGDAVEISGLTADG
ncbi:MAG TPA: RNA polymerase factor sigma-32 [Polyangia bacterium]|nr:RNA polymerase factor sigma-32 [Polyangia bacterium]